MEEKELLGLNSKTTLNCAICDKCCEYRGDIKITPINVLEISKYLKISIQDFLENYTEAVPGEEPERVIKAVGEKRRCIFNDTETFRCNIHKVEPMQCLVFPLVPWDLNQDLFIHSQQCVLKNNRTTTVKKWLNGNHRSYQRNKEIYQNWITLMEEIQPYWNLISQEKREKVQELLYYDYDIRKNFKKQIMCNIEKARDIYRDLSL